MRRIELIGLAVIGGGITYTMDIVGYVGDEVTYTVVSINGISLAVSLSPSVDQWIKAKLIEMDSIIMRLELCVLKQSM